MFCPKCGSQLADDAAFCPHCGNPVERGQASTSTDIPPASAGKIVPAGPASQQNQTNPNVVYVVQKPPAADDDGSFGWAVLGFFIPIVGLILWLVWKDEKPKSAKQAGMGALVSVIVIVALYLLIIVFGAIIAASAASSASSYSSASYTLR